MNTLRGIFPEPKTVPKRNFIRENMLNIKQMQGLIQNATELTRSRSELFRPKINHSVVKSQSRDSSRRSTKDCKMVSTEKLKTLPSSVTDKLKSLNSVIPLDRQKNINNAIAEKQRALHSATDKSKHPVINNPKAVQKLNRKPFHETYLKTAVEKPSLLPLKSKIKEIGVQTDDWVPPKNMISVQTKQKSPQKEKSMRLSGEGDSPTQKIHSPTKKSESPHKTIEPTKLNSPIKKLEVKETHLKKGDSSDPLMAPPTYQKGIVPKYIKDRKEELHKKTKGLEGDEKCPEGHIILPDNERKETLKMLRQSYAELITELNLLPVRSDTLKTRNRKIEIENQLKKLDEGIKVFTRPKVFVKIGA